MKKKIAVLSGGYSEEIIISRKSVQTILDHLDPERFEPFHISVTKEGWFYEKDHSPVKKADFSIVADGITVQFDFVYIMVHGTPGEDGLLQAYFDLLQIPYSSSSQFASTLTFNKWACNALLRDQGYKCAKAILLRKNSSYAEQEIIEQLKLPLFVKPNDGGSSFGVTKVLNTDQLKPAINLAFEHGSEVVLESMLSGTEITAGVVQLDNEIIALPVTEIVSENDFFDYKAKYEGKSSEITPARLSETTTKLVQNTTKSIYKLLGLRGFVRIDYIVENEIPNVIEINTIPGMSPQSVIPQQLQEKGLILKDVLTKLILSQIDN